ncbi:hypothetical protein CDD83_4950 [Cordyceps sp. RAO-2017]|nr:hypothetical protein CDD83_4950 [Cordyceps sp. RAO-2017]
MAPEAPKGSPSPAAVAPPLLHSAARTQAPESGAEGGEDEVAWRRDDGLGSARGFSFTKTCDGQGAQGGDKGTGLEMVLASLLSRIDGSKWTSPGGIRPRREWGWPAGLVRAVDSLTCIHGPSSTETGPGMSRCRVTMDDDGEMGISRCDAAMSNIPTALQIAWRRANELPHRLVACTRLPRQTGTRQQSPMSGQVRCKIGCVCDGRMGAMRWAQEAVYAAACGDGQGTSKGHGSHCREPSSPRIYGKG